MTTSTHDQEHPALLDEHTLVESRLDDFGRWRAELCQLGQPRFGEMGMRIQQIRNLLADHFAAEEEDGYLSAALRVAPQFTARAEQLQRQHQEFLQQLDDHIRRLTATPAQFASWSDACRDCDRLLSRMREHEQAENEIVRSAFELDVENAT